MTPHAILAEAVETKMYPDFKEAWFDFEVWERCRSFRDDPDRESKSALDWVRSLYELSVTLNEFNESPAREQCQNALEAAFVAFSELDHSQDLCDAVRRWKDWRIAERRQKADSI